MTSSTTTMTLTDFLLARIAEDEAVARATTAPVWTVGPSGNVVFSDSDVPVGAGDWTHIVRHDPARVLAECEAKRRIVAEHAEERVGGVVFDPRAGLSRVEMGAAFNARTATQCARCFASSPVAAPCRTLRALALPYADHPDYREEWAL